MKRFLTFALLAVFTTFVSAQLNISSNGSVIAYSSFSAGGALTAGYGTSLYPSTTGILTLKSKNNMQNVSRLIYSNVTTTNTTPVGMWLRLAGSNSSSVGGIRSVVSGGTTNYGIFGGLYGSTNMVSGVGVFGSTTVSPSFEEGGIYAGYFQGDVKATGIIYGTLLSPSSTSSSLCEEGASFMSARSLKVPVTDKLQRVELLKVKRVNQDGSKPANRVVSKRLSKVVPDTFALSDEELSEMEKAAKEDPIQTRLSSISYGLAADQLQEVYPELVYEDADGNYSINYIEMVPLLVQGIKELSAKVRMLEEELGIQNSSETRDSSHQQATLIDETGIDVVTMSQNNPNPFSGSSVISLSIPASAKSAVLSIYDMSGKQVQVIDVVERGETNVTVYSSSLSAGMFLYNLIVDGKVCASRKMIVRHV